MGFVLSIWTFAPRRDSLLSGFRMRKKSRLFAIAEVLRARRDRDRVVRVASAAHRLREERVADEPAPRQDSQSRVRSLADAAQLRRSGVERGSSVPHGSDQTSLGAVTRYMIRQIGSPVSS